MDCINDDLQITLKLNCEKIDEVQDTRYIRICYIPKAALSFVIMTLCKRMPFNGLCLAGLVHPAHVPAVLLAGHGQQLRQPHRLLLDEQEVS